MRVLDAADYVLPPGAANHYRELLRVADLSAGTYCIPAGGVDSQGLSGREREERRPHTEDEVYVVLSGRARLHGGGEVVDVAPGSVVFVPAGEVHYFTDVVADLTVLVLFAPAEGSRR
jgi:mannose-6-phosphate isomerase-like protein (cupin superfamily)